MLFKVAELPLRNKLDAGRSHPSWWHRMDLQDPGAEGSLQLILFRPSWAWCETTKKNPSENKVKIAKKERALPSLYSFSESWWGHLQSNKIWVSWQDTLSYSPRKLCVFLLISTTWLFLPSQVYYRCQFSFHQESNLHCVNVPQSPLESLPIKQFWIQKHFHLHEVQAN